MPKHKKDPWTDPDPQPGDFDEYLDEVDPANVHYFEPGEGFEIIFIRTNDVEGWMKENPPETRRKASAAARKPLQ
jgi:hypothetical protein